MFFFKGEKRLVGLTIVLPSETSFMIRNNWSTELRIH